MPRHPITEKDIIPGSLNAGVAASPLVEDTPSSFKNGAIKTYLLAYLQNGVSQNIVPAFACRVKDVTVYADGLPVNPDAVVVQAVNLINGTSYNLCTARVAVAAPANAIARGEAVTNNSDILPWNGDYIRVDMSSWVNVPAYVRIEVEAI